MDPRTSTNPLVARVRAGLDQVNQRHPWNHNEHFHGWIMRNLPRRRRAALDIGCGSGALIAKLSPRFTHVTGIDPDEAMAASAGARWPADPAVTIRRIGLKEFSHTIDVAEFDLVTMVAVLHHLDIPDTLARVGGLLAPGGRLLVVGLARVDSRTDLLIDCVSAAANPVIGFVKHPHPVRGLTEQEAAKDAMPVKDPTTTFTDVRTAAWAHLNGASVRRRLFFRYTLRWDKPLTMASQ